MHALRLSTFLTAYDSGKIHVFNYPVVVYPAPKREYGGHSSFVCNVRWLHRLDGGLALTSVGGRDATMILWRARNVPESFEPEPVEQADPCPPLTAFIRR